jgi:hypothetical protein
MERVATRVGISASVPLSIIERREAHANRKMGGFLLLFRLALSG